MRDLVLTGFMGTGKTTVGRILADRLGWRFVDTDVEIERRTGRSISDLIRAEGEEAFRAVESQVLAEVARRQSGRVIATGGGAFLDPHNRCIFDSDQPIICLSAVPRELLQRLQRSHDRPLLNPLTQQGVASLLQAREHVYSSFLQVDTTDRSPDDVADSVLAQASQANTGAVIQFESSQTSRIVVQFGAATSIGHMLRNNDPGGKFMVVTDENVAGAGHTKVVAAGLSALDYQISTVTLPAGEQTKSQEFLARLYQEAIDAGLERSGIVVAVGGGVICDLAGMFAATYMRGVRLVLVPTTLLAQVDAAIGGKVGIDFADVKNIVGGFYPAELVVSDPTLLRTLSPRQLSDGLAEVVKIALMRSPDLWARVGAVRSPSQILDTPDLILQAAREKALVVQEDPYEKGARTLLNFGHTVGHALEAASSYRLSHGEAVSVGMVAELHAGISEGWSQLELQEDLVDMLCRLELPERTSGLDLDEVVGLMGHDKKRAAGQSRIAIPICAGKGAVFNVSEQKARAAAAFALDVAP